MTSAHGLREVLVLRLQAPLMSFGGVAVDEHRTTMEFPGRSMLAGLLANALGWQHRDGDELQRLQSRLDYAVRQDEPGEPFEDFHTVDLGQDFLREGWTTHGRPESRGKGSATTGTHIRRLHYLADAAYTVALALNPPEESPTVEALEQALRFPCRPLFLGRKTCLPARPLLAGSGEVHRLQAASPLAALTKVPLWADGGRHARREALRVWWAGEPGGKPPLSAGLPGVRFDRSFPVMDERDWRHQFHAGRRFVNEGSMPAPAGGSADG